MDYKIAILWACFQVTWCNGHGQQFFCDYNLSSSPVRSEACVYNQMNAYSNTDTLARQLITKILSLISLPVNFAIEPCEKINTCRAYVYDNGIRYIFYDPQFIKQLIEPETDNWALLAILAHEIGHHLCGHTLRSADNELHRRNELEADEFAGAIMARLGASEKQAWQSLTEVQHPLCEKETFDSHPCFENRKRKVLSGFRSIHKPDRSELPGLAINLPKVDISRKSTPVRDQGPEATAVGFSIAYALEIEIQRQFNYSVQISPRYIYNSAGGTQLSGIYIDKALQVLIEKGAVEESVWPYQFGDYANIQRQKSADTTSNRYKIKRFYQIPVDVSNFKAVLDRGKAIVIGMRLPDYFVHYTSGVFKLKPGDDCQACYNYTSFCIVGYDDVSRNIRLKGSWGREWGDEGYGYISYDDFRTLINFAYCMDL
ncbi:hypothetical protein LZZ85_00675 [Terrimonas sp. NA20]|uniref:Peptidase C1A papain C-terminal domain-containing protein n=1 Tax=Terrimonas ginsenosidimutans TaxID=2908004 RepID=A0ABS9KKB2_9BACT|nr:C1 family peptidase [Terrimonas ginsenosidimutans]MCG2612764.1 hypothetical protein [Terrimonas ginsenosidimutans]